MGVKVQPPHIVSTDNLVGVEGGESYYHLVGMEVPAPYLAITLMKMRKYGGPLQPGEGGGLGSLRSLCWHGCGRTTFFFCLKCWNKAIII